MNKIIIGIPTYKRPEAFVLALESLSRLKLVKGFSIEVIVVENDKTKNLSKIIKSFKKFKVHYFLEKSQGLVFVRNRILEEALKLNGDFLVGFDDDEVVNPDWLIELVKAQRIYSADVVAGFTFAKFELEPQDWILKGNYFVTKSRKKTGDIISRVGCGNYLFSLKFIKKYNIKYDLRFNFVGGEDTDFSKEIVKKGGRVIWANEALVVENIPSSRLCFRYLLAREFGLGIGRYVKIRKTSFLNSILFLGLSIFKIILYSFLLLFKYSKSKFIKQFLKVVKQVGFIFGFLKLGVFKKKVMVYGNKK